jgi:hypothetical protein
MNRVIIHARPAHIGHKYFLSLVEETDFIQNNMHNVWSLVKPTQVGGKIQFRSWIAPHWQLGIDWEPKSRLLNFGEED